MWHPCPCNAAPMYNGEKLPVKVEGSAIREIPASMRKGNAYYARSTDISDSNGGYSAFRMRLRR